MGGSGVGGTAALDPLEAKQASSHGPPPLSRGSLQEAGRPPRLPPVPTPQPRLSPRAGLAAQRGGPRRSPRKHGWRSSGGARGARERVGAGCGRRRRRGAGGGGELERRGWGQARRGSFPSFFPPLFLPSRSSSFQPLLPVSLLPASRSPAPPPAVTSKPKDKTRPRAVTCGPSGGPEVRLGHCRSPGAHAAAARLIPPSLSGPGGSCSFYGARRQRHCPGVSSQLARAAAASMRAIHTRGPLRGPPWRARPPIRPHPQGLGVGWGAGVNMVLRAPSSGGGHVVPAQGSHGNVGPLRVAATFEMDVEVWVKQDSWIYFKLKQEQS